jgi:CBS domain containing-hemolysin-like protein
MSSLSGAALGRSLPFRFAGNYLDLFKQARVSDVQQKRNTFEYIPSNLTVQDTLEVLNERSFSSAPVQCVESKKCIGFVDVLDIVAYLYKVLV